MKIRCKLCNTIIEGDKKGHMIWCKCEKCAIDETPYYARIIGNFEDYENINNMEETNEESKTKNNDNASNIVD